MSFVHENPEEFADLVQIIVGETGLPRSIIEKDYWVTHVLWALSISGLDVWFKGGTSLSKGFRLIERFSEDLEDRTGLPERFAESVQLEERGDEGDRRATRLLRATAPSVRRARLHHRVRAG